MSKKTRVVMSAPDYFSIQYSINPWMNTDNQVDKVRAKKQWHQLKQAYQDLGLEIFEIPPSTSFPDLVFTTDHGVWIHDTFYLSNFRYPERKGEQNLTIPWYQRQQIKTLAIPSLCYMEGGDILVHHNKIYLGYGFRTSQDTTTYLHNTTRLPVVDLELVNENFYHLDTCFLPINQDTAFYYPPAFTAEGITALKNNFANLVPLSDLESNNFGCNSVIIGQKILCQPNPTFEEKIRTLGYNPITLEMSEFNKSGGGIHCLSQILR
jgi:N-dimethylarginine dimethylaminohydrolase